MNYLVKLSINSRDNCSLAQWAWLKVRRADALHAIRHIFIINVIEDADKSLQPYCVYSQKVSHSPTIFAFARETFEFFWKTKRLRSLTKCKHSLVKVWHSPNKFSLLLNTFLCPPRNVAFTEKTFAFLLRNFAFP